MYTINFSDLAEKQFSKLPHDMQGRVISALERIRVRPEVHVTKLVGDPCYKLRVGDFRVLLDIDRSTLTILVVKLGHRHNIYF